MALNEAEIYTRIVAALTQRQLPLRLRRMKKVKTELPSTMVLTASTKSTPVYAFSMIPVDVRRRELGFKYTERVESPYAYNPPYGILPQLATLSPVELQKLANHFSILKFQYQERGDYYHAWLFGWRERMIEQVLNGSASIDLIPQN